MWCASCVPLLSTRKETGSEGKPANPGSTLVKPKLAPDSGGTETSPSEKLQEPDASEKPRKPEKLDSFEGKTSMLPGKSDELHARQETAKTKEDPSKEPLSETSDRMSGEKMKDRDTDSITGKKSPAAPANPLATELAKSDTMFKKHDHSKYTQNIKNKAIDEVNRESACKYARLCRDTITHDWGLTLYYLQEKTYVMVTYVWDEIDEKWKKSFSSDKRPMSGWKHHLDFSSGGKACKVLKGTRQ